MKPRNFPTRKLRRQLLVKWRSGVALTQGEMTLVNSPKDIRIRKGAAGWGTA